MTGAKPTATQLKWQIFIIIGVTVFGIYIIGLADHRTRSIADEAERRAAAHRERANLLTIAYPDDRLQEIAADPKARDAMDGDILRICDREAGDPEDCAVMHSSGLYRRWLLQRSQGRIDALREAAP